MNNFVSHSQAAQDYFVYKILIEGKEPKEGTFVDIGCNDPIAINNTYTLEHYYGWKGLLIDICDFSKEIKDKRTSAFLQIDVKQKNWFELAITAGLDLSKPIDYLSFDIDADGVSVIENFPFDRVTFRVMTIEHDKYRFGDEAQIRMREAITRHGYEPICTDVQSVCGKPYEDWYVHPEYVDIDRARKYRCDNLRWTDIVASVFTQA